MSTLDEIVAMFPGEMGIYAKEIAPGADPLALNQDSMFYIASITKICILVAVVDALDDADPDGISGTTDMNLVLTSTHKIRMSDYRDEGHRYLFRHIGITQTLEELVRAMISASDATATDIVVSIIGISHINEVVKRLGITGIGQITSIGELEKILASNRGPGWERIPAHAVRPFELNSITDLVIPAYRTKIPKRPGARSQYTKYYRSGLNSATPHAIGELLEMIATDRIFGPTGALGGNVLKSEILRTLFSAGGRGSAGQGLPSQFVVNHKGGIRRGVNSEAGIISERLPGGVPGAPVAVYSIFTRAHGPAANAIANHYIRAAAAAIWRELNPIPNSASINITSDNGLYNVTSGTANGPPLVWTSTGLGGVRLRLDVINVRTDVIRPQLTISDNINDVGIWTEWERLSELAQGRYRFRLSISDDPDSLSEISNPFRVGGSVAVPNLRFQLPAAADFYGFGTTPRIRWESHGISGQLTLSLLKNERGGDRLMRVISNNVTDDGEWQSWQVGTNDSSGASYRLKLESNNDDSIIALSAYFAIGAGISLLSPVRTSSLVKGSQPIIRWRSAGLDGGIHLTLTGRNMQRAIASNARDVGRFSRWTVPDQISENDHYRIRIKSKQNRAIKDQSEPFVVGGRIEILSPFEGDIFALGSRPEIRWRTENISGRVRIELRRGDHTIQAVIAENALNDGLFNHWRVPQIEEEGIGFRIVVSSSENPNIYGISTTFQIGSWFEWLTPGIEQVGFGSIPNVRPTFMAFNSNPILSWRRKGAHHGNLKIKLRRGDFKRTINSNFEDGLSSRTSLRDWTVPNDLVPASDYYLSLIVRNNQQNLRFKSQLFHLGAMINVNPITVGLGSQALVSEIKSGSRYTITWSSVNVGGRLVIDLMSQTSVVTGTKLIANDNGVITRWKAPKGLTESKLYRIRIRSSKFSHVVGLGPWLTYLS